VVTASVADMGPFHTLETRKVTLTGSILLISALLGASIPATFPAKTAVDLASSSTGEARGSQLQAEAGWTLATRKLAARAKLKTNLLNLNMDHPSLPR
jgi:hypothetical protein